MRLDLHTEDHPVTPLNDESPFTRLEGLSTVQDSAVAAYRTCEFVGMSRNGMSSVDRFNSRSADLSRQV